MRGRILVVWIAALVLIGGVACGVTTSPAKTPETQASAPTKAKPTGCGRGHSTCTPTPTPTTSSPRPPSGHKVMVIVEENHTQAEATTLMPHLASWAATYGKATAYTAATHPSLPNYLAIAGGNTFGVTDDNAPS